MPQIRGGMGIINPKADRPGTIGLIVARNGSRYLLSCYHVLCRLNQAPFEKGEPIYLAEDVIRDAPIARTDLGLAERDVAAALVVGGVDALSGIVTFPLLSEPVEPEEEMEVVKMGYATGRTEGRITRVEGDDVWIEAANDATDEPISQGGDSGAVWVQKNLWAPVVLHTGTNDTGIIPYARGIALLRVLNVLGLSPLSP